MSAAGRGPGKGADLARGLAWLGLAGLGALWARQPAAPLAAPLLAPAGGAPRDGGSSGFGGGFDGGSGADADGGHRTPSRAEHDRGPGDEHPEDAEGTSGLKGYTIGFGLALALTLMSFGLPATGLVWGPAVPVALIVFALAQIGIHLVFFLHLTTGPDNINNAMALAFGVLVVGLVIGGSLWIMYNLNSNMLPTMQMMDMRR